MKYYSIMAFMLLFPIIFGVGVYVYSSFPRKDPYEWIKECGRLQLPTISGHVSELPPPPFLPIFMGSNGEAFLFTNRKYAPLTNDLLTNKLSELEERPTILIIAHPEMLFMQTRPLYKFANDHCLPVVFIGKNVGACTGGYPLFEISKIRHSEEIIVTIHESYVDFNGERFFDNKDAGYKISQLHDIIMLVHFDPACSVQRVLSVFDAFMNPLFSVLFDSDSPERH